METRTYQVPRNVLCCSGVGGGVERTKCEGMCCAVLVLVVVWCLRCNKAQQTDRQT